MKTTNSDVKNELKLRIKKSFLDTLGRSDSLDSYELSLFEWYSKEHSTLIDKMTLAEQTFVREQQESDVDDLNDSGIVAIEYFIKRVRYADIIYITSLLESYLDRVCKKVIIAVGEETMMFSLEDLSGDKWSKRRKFIERYCGFSFDKTNLDRLETLTMIRNNLVHDNGALMHISKNNITKIRAMPGIDVSGSELVFEKQFIDCCLDEFRFLTNFLDEMFKLFIDRCKQPKLV